MADQPAILFYDGVCGLCNGAVRFVLRHDRAERVRVAPLQSDLAKETLRRFGKDVDQLDTMYLFTPAAAGEPVLLERSDAAIETMQLFGGPWRMAGVLRLVPRSWRDRAYDWVAANRYRWFGKYDSCPLPEPELARRFADRSAA
ncbi:MAG TPA: DCC1-like thiol-disulfide oxidoreductase family protein [Terriglobales bacterium]|nr:DCC1-like thiol-disulfide oxidoreductase family protein [Terriglobales bacterium]